MEIKEKQKKGKNHDFSLKLPKITENGRYHYNKKAKSALIFNDSLGSFFDWIIR